MIELYQIPYSPFCLVIRRVLDFAGARWKSVIIPQGDRALVWKLTRQRYYQVPVIKDGRTVVFETDEDSQVIAKYLDHKLKLGLFPPEHEGVQEVLWRYFEHEIEAAAHKLNDSCYEEFVPRAERLSFLRHKERRFGRGCLAQWATQRPHLEDQLARLLIPCERMLARKPHLLGERPVFVDFDLWGMLANFLYSGHYKLPGPHARLRKWYDRLSKAKVGSAA
jgi:glutathione S-transferase